MKRAIHLSSPPAISADLDAAIEQAIQAIPPLWPLDRFVAVNPFLGLLEHSFDDAAQILARVAGARLTMPRQFYARALEDGVIEIADLAEAQSKASPPLPLGVCELAAAAKASPSTSVARLPTVTDVAEELTGVRWSTLAVESISEWALTYFDGSSPIWRSPWAHLEPYAAWRAEASHDRSPHLRGLRGFHHRVLRHPSDARAAILVALQCLGIPREGLGPYLHRLLMSVAGWAGHARRRAWDAQHRGEVDSAIESILAIRLTWECLVFECLADRGIGPAWATARTQLSQDLLRTSDTPDLRIDLVLHAAYENAIRHQTLGSLMQDAIKPGPRAAPPLVQAAFCIDVRSEVFRRALESIDPHCDTVGVAGFFGVPMDYTPADGNEPRPSCPVLIAPSVAVHETVSDSSVLRDRKRSHAAWATFKASAISSFGFVEACGLVYARRLWRDAFAGRSTPTRDHGTPSLAAIPLAVRTDLAASLLSAMTLTRNFARLVVLAGHGSTSVNNPHAAGLDCGACGGQQGGPNARVAAAMLNDGDVRETLSRRGIEIPPTTVFLAAQHDTTTDEVALFDEAMPPSHLEDLVRLRSCLRSASKRARAERARRMAVEIDESVDAAILARSRDWSEVRPEYGLAGCSTFIIGPRAHTARRDLQGRAFLHSYDWRSDPGFLTLETIMTAPMVVTSWINLQYYASTVEPDVFGAGNKVLHNVVGTSGVLEGSRGDLRVGLPIQSVFDGGHLLHEPVRLSVVISAPMVAMNQVIAKHEVVRRLVDNGWVHLFAMNDTGAITHRYVRDLLWISMTRDGSTIAA